MAGELQASYNTGSTLYAILRNGAGAVWNGSAFDATPTDGEWGTYDIAMAEDATTGLFRGDMPAVAAGAYAFEVRLRAGGVGTEASTDRVIGQGWVEWDGTAEVGATSILSKLLKYAQLMLRKDAAIATDNATELAAINASGGSGAGAFLSTTDSQEGIRDAITAGGATAEEIADALLGVGAHVSPANAPPAAGSLGVFTRGTKWVFPPVSVGALPADRTALWMTIKELPGPDDSRALLQVEETDGLLVLNQAEAEDPAGASLTYDSGDQEVSGVVLTETTLSFGARLQLYFDIKYRAVDGESFQVAVGTLGVADPITLRIA